MCCLFKRLRIFTSAWVILLMNLSLSQDEEVRTPLWIEKGDMIISIKPNATMSIKEPAAANEKFIKYVDVDHGKREIYYKVKGKSDIFSHKFDNIEYLKPLKKGVPYAAKVVALSGALGASLGYYSVTSDGSSESESEKIFQSSFTSAIISGLVGSYLLSEKRSYISSFVYIEDTGVAVRKFPELMRIEKNEWKIIE